MAGPLDRTPAPKPPPPPDPTRAGARSKGVALWLALAGVALGALTWALIGPVWAGVVLALLLVLAAIALYV